MTKPVKSLKLNNILNEPFYIYPIILIDYLWVITIYVTSAFLTVVLIDGHLLAKFNIEETMKRNSFILAFEILVQLMWQGFVAIILSSILHNVYSPMNGIYGYTSNSMIGHLIRNPAIIYIILFSQSKALQGKIQVFFSRFDRNNVITSIESHDKKEENVPKK
jgi:hypothetical protein